MGGGRSRISDITSQGPVIDVFKIGDGRSRSPTTPPGGRGGVINVFKIGGGCSWISSTTLGGLPCNILELHGRCSQTSDNTSQGSTMAHITSRMFFQQFFSDLCAASDRERSTTTSNKDDMMAPPASSLPLPRWARGPLSVPCE
jgi:hypothetical protein